MQAPLKVALFGAGHLGKIHLKCIGLADNLVCIGFYDPDDDIAEAVVAEHDLVRYTDPAALIAAADIVDIVTPTLYHYATARQAIEAGKHVFIEKPVTHTLDEARELHRLQQQHGVKIQVGHVERFNPAVRALDGMPVDPMFIEAHRLSTFNPRGTDVSVVLDLMIHDLDIVLHMVQSEVESVSASGVSIVSRTPDIANARLEFANGCVANLTASRMSLKQMRKVRLFQRDAYISLDLLQKDAQVVRLHDTAPKGHSNLLELPTADGTRYLQIAMPDIEPVNAIKEELQSFGSCILTDTPPVVSLTDGYKALEVAYRILDEIQQRESRYRKDTTA